ncbi:1-(5-phosphoribosyl)-5-[(5-phosphoribosylamino)methylideneamino] imidazole-4-carboxamide isomerase [Geochorda subterranea]|uniref:1-(5-phosphoribosyl)-5-[(5-phosphoribosylamino)methylideneamino]imidazole-4-carboxamideisomerase n=1 Tax=Geochorda subterranea TaxID=3109564 RepID=A0ABZ1BRT9_9FIRM|nr:1-(5-phosphoribosyl)-5-[(5-phosphoribosylamino)methylideneamino] imidazole-4-carboxamide isomerase [Limnochorda sp. LNt]WRP15404.1 1-(5-phosphoribosyl)-5-[(5-phosphoribosylamino)methylideneamino] imidazole-4-carboxamide isomerase [Limnochorda sp. LNt]
MREFWVVPAIDLMEGTVVRLRQGRFDEATRYARDPIGWARALVAAGARRLHVVDLDGARQGRPAHLPLLERIAQAAGVPVQFGGGLRSLESVRQALQAGASAVMLGTGALDPGLIEPALAAWGAERVWAAIDVRGGRVVVSGWTEASDQSPAELARRLHAAGVRWALVTDTQADGTSRASTLRRRWQWRARACTSWPPAGWDRPRTWRRWRVWAWPASSSVGPSTKGG